MIVRILLGYDASGSADDAFDFAVDLARRYEAELHIVAVVQPPEFAQIVESQALIENSQRFHRELLAPLQTRMAAWGVPGRCTVLVGHPAEQLLSYAVGHGVNHIVVGHRGHSVFERWLLGSVARRLIVHADCAVTVVRRNAARADGTPEDTERAPASS